MGERLPRGSEIDVTICGRGVCVRPTDERELVLAEWVRPEVRYGNSLSPSKLGRDDEPEGPGILSRLLLWICRSICFCLLTSSAKLIAITRAIISSSDSSFALINILFLSCCRS